MCRRRRRRSGRSRRRAFITCEESTAIDSLAVAGLGVEVVPGGLVKSGIKLLVTGDVVDDYMLAAMGDAVDGVISSIPYQVELDNKANNVNSANLKRPSPRKPARSCATLRRKRLC